MVAEQMRVEYEDGLDERGKLEAQVRVSQQRCNVGHSNDYGRERWMTDTDCVTTPTSEGRCSYQSPLDSEATDGALQKKKKMAFLANERDK